MRDLLLFAFLIGLAPLMIAMPHIGVLAWSWLSFMNPHRETFGFAFDFHVVIWVAIGTIVAWAVANRPRLALSERTAVLMTLFFVWTAVTTAFAIDPAWSFPFFTQNVKTLILAVVVLSLLTTKTRIQAFIWVIAISLGYFAVKGSGFTLLTGGQYRVLGPDDTMIGDNNHLGAALVMSLPLLNHLRITSRRPSVGLLVSAVMVATVIATIGTYSRGGLFGLIIVALIMWLRSRHKFLLTVGFVAVVLAVPAIVPAQWFERMQSIGEYAEDDSFQGRQQAWSVTTKLALERPLVGGGFNATQIDSVFAKYNLVGPIRAGRAAHSIYFQVLGDHGFVGFGLYLAMIALAFFNIGDTIRLSRRRGDLLWLRDLAGMTQVSLIGMLAAGALLSMAYYDVFLVLVALTGRMRMLAMSPDAGEQEARTAGWQREVKSSAGPRLPYVGGLRKWRLKPPERQQIAPTNPGDGSN